MNFLRHENINTRRSSKKRELIIMIVIMIIALKGANQDFYNLLTAPRTVSSRFAQVARA